MAEKTPAFHEAYAGLISGLPPSQLREAYKRLSTAKVPLTDEEICSEHPRVLATLERLASAYIRKKARSAIASKARREAAKEPVEPVLANEEVLKTVEPVAALLEACSLEPVEVEVEVECAAPPPPAATIEEVAVDADVVANPPSSGIAKPLPRRLVRAPPATPPRTAAKKATGNSLVSSKR